jgi:2-aminophenol/2-amino-5-chlorophenol 1,6-dioxygenase alpha subunit
MILKGYMVPGLVQPLLTPKAHPGYQSLRAAFDVVKDEIASLRPDLLLVYSTMWPSILGHQVQAREKLKWIHVDEEFHDLGSIPYEFSFDQGFAKALCVIGAAKGLSMKSVDYDGFPVDTGSVVTLSLLNPNNEFKSSIVSSNIYADRAETVVLGKACKEALQNQNLKAVAIVVSTLSNRLHQQIIKPSEDKIHSLKDQEWNLKAIEFLRAGRLEDLSQLSRQIHKEARVKKVNNFKPLWWLSSLMGTHNRYTGNVFSYEPVYGTGCVVASLTPATSAARDLEFDEDSPEFFQGERNVLENSEANRQQSAASEEEDF